jgi:hypothetical protein
MRIVTDSISVNLRKGREMGDSSGEPASKLARHPSWFTSPCAISFPPHFSPLNEGFLAGSQCDTPKSFPTANTVDARGKSCAITIVINSAGRTTQIALVGAKQLRSTNWNESGRELCSIEG